MDIYDAYKPLRNSLRNFSLEQSLIDIWAFGCHLTDNVPLPPHFDLRNIYGRPVSLTMNGDWPVYSWELETLAREAIINSSTTSGKGLATLKGITDAISHIRRIDNQISANHTSATATEDFDIFEVLQRLTNRQFPAQTPTTLDTLIRYHKIFGATAIENIVINKIGMTVTQLYQFGFAIVGRVMSQPGLTTRTDYNCIGISREQSDKLFTLFSISLEALRKNLKEKESFNDDWLYTLNALQSTPLISIFPAHPDRLICPLPTLLLKRITSGLYYDLVSAPGFPQLFGDAFQAYVGEVIEECCPAPQFSLIPEESYHVGKDLKHGADWIVTDDSANLFVECKTKRLTYDAKFLTQGHDFSGQLDVMVDAIVQNYKNIVDATSGKTPWTPNERPIYPLIVTLEDWFFINFTATKIIRERVSTKLLAAGLSADMLDTMPYSIMSVADLEMAGQVISETGIHGFFSLKCDSTHRDWGMMGFIQTQFLALGKRPRPLFIKDWQKLAEAFVKPS